MKHLLKVVFTAMLAVMLGGAVATSTYAQDSRDAGHSAGDKGGQDSGSQKGGNGN